jgi:hypothetical protein
MRFGSLRVVRTTVLRCAWSRRNDGVASEMGWNAQMAERLRSMNVVRLRFTPRRSTIVDTAHARQIEDVDTILRRLRIPMDVVAVERGVQDQALDESHRPRTQLEGVDDLRVAVTESATGSAQQLELDSPIALIGLPGQRARLSKAAGLDPARLDLVRVQQVAPRRLGALDREGEVVPLRPLRIGVAREYEAIVGKEALHRLTGLVEVAATEGGQLSRVELELDVEVDSRPGDAGHELILETLVDVIGRESIRATRRGGLPGLPPSRHAAGRLGPHEARLRVCGDRLRIVGPRAQRRQHDQR